MKSTFTRIVEVTLTLNEKEVNWLRSTCGEVPLNEPTEDKKVRLDFLKNLPTIEQMRGGDST